MQNLLVLVFTAATLFGSVATLVCKDKADGYYEISCLTMTKCVNHVAITEVCPPHLVVDVRTHTCKAPSQVKPPCNYVGDCSSKSDGRYPVLTRCDSYYTCLAKHFLGVNFCPTTLVFNSGPQLCDFPFNVPKPCGDNI